MAWKINATWRFFILLSLSLLFLPLKWFLAWIVASFIHELFHILALTVFRCKILGIKFDGAGVRIISEPITGLSRVICSLAGPVGSFSLIALINHFPVLAICGIVQGIYNSLPFFPLDGWHILSSSKYKVFREIAKLICGTTLVAIGIHLLLHSFGLLPLLLSLFIILRDMKNTLQLRG